MIKVQIKRQKSTIVELQIKGHSMSAEHGKDLVCAGVSAIGVGGLNAVYALDSNAKLVMEDGFILIKDFVPEDHIQMVLKTLIIQLKTIQEKYPEYIQITENP